MPPPYVKELHSEQERFRATIQLRTPAGEPTTIIILGRGRGRDGRVWLTFDGALKTTVTMDDQEVDKVIDMIKAAQSTT
ncbi:MAG: hypothetical protein ACRDTF_20925 [Pseudonocardiaceae bacterium]